jgi:hypothetical protein
MRTWVVFAALVVSACQSGPLTEPLAEATTPAGWEVLEGRGVRMALPPDWAGGIPDASLRRQIELAVRPGVGGLDEDVAEQALRLLREAPERLLFFAIDIREPGAAYFANVNAVDLGIAPHRSRGGRAGSNGRVLPRRGASPFSGAPRRPFGAGPPGAS